MDIIGNNLGYNKVAGEYMNFSKLFKATLLKIGLPNISKESKQKNAQFNEILLKLYNTTDDIASFLLSRGYNVLSLFENDESLIRYIIENRIKGAINEGKILIGHIYGIEDCIKCLGIILATEVTITDNQANALSEEIDAINKKIIEQMDKFSRNIL